MVILPFAASLLLAATAAAPADSSAPINVREEPHHHLVLENAHVRAFRVSIPDGEAAALHQHDLPYFFMMLGPAAFANDVTGKPEVHVVMTDGQAAYSRGGFSHLVRPDAGTAFNNVTVELLDPPGNLHNLCQKVSDGPLDCSASRPGRVPLFESDAIRVAAVTLSAKGSESGAVPAPRLLVVGQDSQLTLTVAGEPAKVVHGGEVVWVDAGKSTRLSSGRKRDARYLEIRFTGPVPLGPDSPLATFNREFAAATQSMNNAAVMEFWDEQGVSLLPETRPISGKAAIGRYQDGVTAKFPGAKMTAFTFDCFDALQSGDWASEWCSEHQVVVFPDAPAFDGRGKLLLVLHRTGGKWRIQSEMWNQGLPPSAP